MAYEVKFLISRKMAAYLKQVAELEGFGDTQGEVIQRFAWDRINELIAGGRLVELVDSVNPTPKPPGRHNSTGESNV